MVYFQEGDIILKQDDINEYLYYIQDGIAEVIIESMDFMFFDAKSVKKFISHNKDNERYVFFIYSKQRFIDNLWIALLIY